MCVCVCVCMHACMHACRILCLIFSAPLDKCQGAWLLDHMVSLCLVLNEINRLSSKVALSFCIFTSSEWKFLFHILPPFVVMSILDFGHFNKCVVISVISYCLLICISLKTYDMDHINLLMFCAYMFVKVSVKVFNPFFNPVLFFLCWVSRCFAIFWIRTLYQMYLLQMFSLFSVDCLFILLTLPFTEQTILMKSSLSFMNCLCCCVQLSFESSCLIPKLISFFLHHMWGECCL